MRSSKAEMNAWIRQFRQEEGRDLSADEIATKLESVGWPMPKPKTPHELLAKKVSDTQSEETIFDEVLGEHVRRNICYPVEVAGKQIMLWADLDTTTRKKVDKFKTLLRDQTVGDVYNATLLCMRRNRLFPEDEPLHYDADFMPDIEWRLAAKQAKAKGKGA